MEKSENKLDVMYYLKITLPLLIIASVIAVLMAAVNAITWEKIEQNENAAMYESISAIYPEYDEVNKLEVEVTFPVTAVYEVIRDGKTEGWCVHSSPKGFGGTVELMTGVTPDGTIAGVRVISNSETPGVGSRAVEETYLDTYGGLGGSLSVGNGVDAVSGATIK